MPNINLINGLHCPKKFQQNIFSVLRYRDRKWKKIGGCEPIHHALKRSKPCTWIFIFIKFEFLNIHWISVTDICCSHDDSDMYITNFYGKNILYIILGGYMSKATARCFQYKEVNNDPDTGKWTEMKSLLNARYGHRSIMDGNSVIHIGGWGNQ